MLQNEISEDYYKNLQMIL